MKLIENFLFSQHKLQDFVDCPRRFQLRYIQNQEWPAIRSEPVLDLEAQMLLGQRFHLLAQQFFSGIPSELISNQLDSPVLLNWFDNFQNYATKIIFQKSEPELVLHKQYSNHRLIAILDLLVLTENENFFIFDWKTNQRKMKRSYLQKNIQSRLYPFILVEIGNLWGVNVNPDQVEMIYWFANAPRDPEHFAYSKKKYQEDREYFANLISQIRENPEENFYKTDILRHCNFCNYRSLCNCGIRAGIVEDDSEYDYTEKFEDLDMTNLEEIAF